MRQVAQRKLPANLHHRPLPPNSVVKTHSMATTTFAMGTGTSSPLHAPVWRPSQRNCVRRFQCTVWRYRGPCYQRPDEPQGQKWPRRKPSAAGVVCIQSSATVLGSAEFPGRLPYKHSRVRGWPVDRKRLFFAARITETWRGLQMHASPRPIYTGA